MASKDKSSWPFFAFGVGTVLAVGILGALWLLFRKLSNLQGMAGQGVNQLAGPPMATHQLGQHPFSGNGNYFAGPVHVFMGERQQQQQLLPVPTMAPSSMALEPPARESRATTMKSFTLRNSDSTRLFTGTKNSGWRVEVAVVGPPGTFGVFSINQALMSTSTFTESMVIPAGGDREVFLAPKDILYGQGNVDGVVVSVTANPSTNYG